MGRNHLDSAWNFLSSSKRIQPVFYYYGRLLLNRVPHGNAGPFFFFSDRTSDDVTGLDSELHRTAVTQFFFLSDRGAFLG